MQGLSAIRIANCSFHCSARSPAAKQNVFLLGFQQTSSSLTCCRKRVTPIYKASLQDGSAIENAPTPLVAEVPWNQADKEVINDTMALEEVSRNQAEEEVKDESVALEEGLIVKVKFVLEKKCRFGQRFNVLGNDASLGNWEVKAAIPMEWADGDIWTVELDVPADKQFEFKFVLTGENTEVEWQPGSNRLFKTMGSISSLVVNEAWDSVEEATAIELEEDTVNNTSTTSETDGMLVPADMSSTEDPAKDEIVKALESTHDGTEVHSTPTESDTYYSAPEVPMAELDIATTVVKSVVGVEDTV